MTLETGHRISFVLNLFIEIAFLCETVTFWCKLEL